MSATDGEWAPELAELRARVGFASELGGPEAVARHRAAGRLTIRDRIDRLADPGSFSEVGRLAGRAVRAEDGSLESVKPSNYLIGSLEVGGRPAVITGYDHTVRGGAIEGGLLDKRPYAERMAHDLKVPLIRLVEGVGASVRGVKSIGSTHVPTVPGWEWSVANLSRVPVVAAALGSLAGLPAIEVTASHFSVMVKGQAHVFVAGPPLVKAATGVDIDKESLGGWQEATRAGSVDAAVETEEEALELLRRVLGYLPSNVWQLPPRAEPTDDPDRTDPVLRSLVPRARRPLDVRRLFASVADEGSAGASHRNPTRHTFRVAWPSGHWGSLPLQGGVDAAYRRVIEAADDPVAKRAELQRSYEQMTSPFRRAEVFGVEDIIDPAETRPRLCRWVRTAYHTMASGPVGPSGRTFRP